jgi:hypothetical protein
MSEWKRFDDDDLVIPPVLARALEGVDPDTERWVIDFFRALRSQHNKMQSRYYERCDHIEVLEYKILELRNLLARVHDELGEYMPADLRNTIAKELALPTAIRRRRTERTDRQSVQATPGRS